MALKGSTQMWHVTFAYIPLVKTSLVAKPDVHDVGNTLFLQREAPEKSPVGWAETILNK